MITLLLWIGAALCALGVLIYGALAVHYSNLANKNLLKYDGSWERYHKLEGRFLSVSAAFSALTLTLVAFATL